MKLFVFTKEDSEEMGHAKEIGKGLEEEGFSVEYFDTDEADAVVKMELYDIYSTPSFVLARDDGSEVQVWRGYVPPRGEVLLQLNT